MEAPFLELSGEIPGKVFGDFSEQSLSEGLRGSRRDSLQRGLWDGLEKAFGKVSGRVSVIPGLRRTSNKHFLILCYYAVYPREQVWDGASDSHRICMMCFF